VSNLHRSEVDVLSLVVALEVVYRHCKGAFTCVVQISETLMVGFRDPHGLKPLVLGERHRHDESMDYMFASESVVLDKLGFSNMRNILPGQFHPN
jgi:amidophosphoribosyltransferase